MPHHLPPGGLGIWVELERLEQLQDDLLVVLGLLEILLPFLLQLVVLRAAERRLVDCDTALLRLERLIEELMDLFHLQGLGHRSLTSFLVVFFLRNPFALLHAAAAKGRSVGRLACRKQS